MQLVLVTDIFGRTQHVDQLAASLAVAGIEVIVVDPYAGADPGLVCETTAYASFTRRCGHDAFKERVRHAIAGCDPGCLLLGFSAGASAAWRAVAGSPGERVSHLIGFYPGQIRNHTALRPECPVTLIFPRYEDHFDVPVVMASLPGQGDVSCLRIPWLHGFMNPISLQYSAEAAKQISAVLCQPEMLMSVSALRQRLQGFALTD